MLEEDEVIIASKDLSMAELEGESIVLDVQSGQYYGLNEVGSCIFQFLDTPKRVSEIIDYLGDQYDVERETLKKDVEKFIAALSERKMILIRQSA